MRRPGIFLLVLATAGCDTGVFAPTDPDVPIDLAYELIPSGDPDVPLGILLQWTPPRSGRANAYDVYARSSSREEFQLRATTSSPSFHDAGIPQLDYFVSALDQDGQELGRSDIVTVDERNRLPAPLDLASVTLNHGVQLSWDANAYDAGPELFSIYRVYSTSSSNQGACDDTQWALEGTTVSEEFVARNLPNGATRCFAVSAVSLDGHESVWSNVKSDTPRFDARSIVLDASDVRRVSSGFILAQPGSGTFGVVVADTTPGVDVILEHRSDGALWLRAARGDVRIAQYGMVPVSELTSIDRAPSVGYVDAVRVMAGFGYAVRVQYADGVHYAAIRVVHVATDFVLFDFAFQSQIGSPELMRAEP